jgi:hypothetical protein
MNNRQATLRCICVFRDSMAVAVKPLVADVVFGLQKEN